MDNKPPEDPSYVVPLNSPGGEKTPEPEPDAEMLPRGQNFPLTADVLLVQSAHIFLGKIPFCAQVVSTPAPFEEANSQRCTFFLMQDGIDDNMNPKYKLYKEVPTSQIKKVSPWKGMSSYVHGDLIIKWTEEEEVFKSLFDARFIAGAKALYKAGIRSTWKTNIDQQLECRFYIKRESVFSTYHDCYKELPSICRVNTPYLLNLLMKHLLPRYNQTNDLPWINSCSRLSQAEIPPTADLDFTSFFKFVTEKAESRRENVPPRYFLNEEKLGCSLMNYQKKTVRWMIHREKSPALNYGKLLHAIKLPVYANSNQQIYYFPYFGAFTESSDINYDVLNVRGGILADEMGLGKTIEVLALINSVQKDAPARIMADSEEDEEFGSNRVQKKLKTDEHWEKLDKAKKIDKSRGNSCIFTPVDDQSSAAKKKKNNVEETMLKCSKCFTICVKEKCHWKDEYEEKYGPFECPQCFEEKEPLEVKTTLIVLPESLVVQWYNEIDNICPSELSVLFYYGINKNGYLHPYEIAEYDIILTTYETLKKELDFVRDISLIQKRTRYGDQSHKFSPSSFTHISWWRLVIDESQVVEGAARKVPMMCANMRSNSYWCVSGTPLVKSVNDVYFLFKFLGVWPFSVDDFWSKYAYPDYKYRALKNADGEVNVVVDIASQILRRNTKEAVQNEIKLPRLQEHVRLVRFSAIEERQYTEEKEKLKKVVENALYSYPDDVHLTTMSSRERVMNALCRLRDTLISCGEHVNFSEKRYAVRKNLNEQVLFGHETVMLRLIRQKKTQVEEYLRYTVSSYFAAAGVELLDEKNLQAVLNYRNVFECLEIANDTNEHFQGVMNLNLENVEDIDSDTDDIDMEDQAMVNEAFDKLRTEFHSERSHKRDILCRTVGDIRSFRKKKNSRKTSIDDDDDMQSQASGSQESISADESEQDAEPNEERENGDEEGPSTSKRPRMEENKAGSSKDGNTTKEVINDDFQKNLDIIEKTSQIMTKSLERKAMRPIRIDPTMHAHLVMNLKDLTKHFDSKKEAERLIEDIGGEEKMMKDYFASMTRYCKVETNGLTIIREEWKNWAEEWRAADQEMSGVVTYINDIGLIYKDKDMRKSKKQPKLVDRVVGSDLFPGILAKLPFVPSYTKARHHFKKEEEPKEFPTPPPEIVALADGNVNGIGVYQSTHKPKRKVPHDLSSCMGFCGSKTFEKVYAEETQATTLQMLHNYVRQLKRIEDIRIDLFVDFFELIEMFFINNSEIAAFQQSAQIDGPIEEMREIMYCEHEVMDVKREEIISNRTFQNTKCQLCRTAIKVATLQFESGFGSYHGVSRPRTALYNLLSLIANFERRSNSSVDFKEPLRQFREYLDRLRRTLLLFNASLSVVQEYTNRLKELDTARERIKMAQLKCASKSSRLHRFQHLPDNEIRDMAKNSFVGDAKGCFEKLKAGCKEVRYLAFLFAEEKSGSIGADNPCPICGTHMEAFVVFPCGHRICEECYKRLRECSEQRNDGRDNVECVTCRRKYAPKTLMIAKCRTEKSKCVIPGVTLAVKLESTIRLIHQLLNEDSSNKIILFSSVEPNTPIWRFLTQVLARAHIPFVEAARKDFGKRIYQFESAPKSNVLVCSLSMCANGLNLSNANHIIFLDPCHLGSVVAQAIGRISRYGQTREMHVHHMLVESSIDEILKDMADRSDTEKEQTGWNLGEIRQMFGIGEAADF